MDVHVDNPAVRTDIGHVRTGQGPSLTGLSPDNFMLNVKESTTCINKQV